MEDTLTHIFNYEKEKKEKSSEKRKTFLIEKTLQYFKI